MKTDDHTWHWVSSCTKCWKASNSSSSLCSCPKGVRSLRSRASPFPYISPMRKWTWPLEIWFLTNQFCIPDKSSKGTSTPGFVTSTCFLMICLSGRHSEISMRTTPSEYRSIYAAYDVDGSPRACGCRYMSSWGSSDAWSLISIGELARENVKPVK